MPLILGRCRYCDYDLYYPCNSEERAGKCIHGLLPRSRMDKLKENMTPQQRAFFYGEDELTLAVGDFKDQR